MGVPAETPPPLAEATVLFLRVEEQELPGGAGDPSRATALSVVEARAGPALRRLGGHPIHRASASLAFAFHDPADALRAALALQEALPAGDQPTGTPGVGVGLHLGPLVARPDPSGGGQAWLGTPLTLAARLAQAAQGGQALLTRAVLNAAEEHGFPVDDPGRERGRIGFRGVHRLRGLGAPVEILELRPSGLPAAPPPPTLGATLVLTQLGRDGQAPAHAGPLFGREDALTRAASALQAGERVLLLLGEPGVGKSRLAAELALWCEAGLGELRFPDGVCCVPLGEPSSAEAVAVAVARALGADPPAAEAATVVGRLLAARSAMMLVLDELDLVAPLVGPLIGRWVERAPELRVVLTSRRAPPGLRARAIPLGPLATPPRGASAQSLRRSPSVILLLERLRGRFGRAVHRSDAELLATLGALARRVDGLPLALVALVERGGGETLEDWRAAMERWLEDLTVRLAPTPACGEALRGELDRAWSALPPWGRAALAQLSLLRGRWLATEAAPLLELGPWPDAPPPLAALGLLLDEGLIAPAAPDEVLGEERAFRLHATTLAYASERLSRPAAVPTPAGQGWGGPAARAGLEARHVERFSAFGAPDRLAELDGDRGALALARLSCAADDLAAALRRAGRRRDGPRATRLLLALAALVERRGHRSLLDPAPALLAALEGAVEPLTLSWCGLAVARAELLAGRPGRARELLGPALARAPRDAPPGLRGRLGVLALEIAAALGGLREAGPRLDRALELVERADDPESLGAVLLARAGLAPRLGVEPSAEELALALRLARARGDRAQELCGLHLLAERARGRGELDGAWGHLRLARALAPSLGPARAALHVDLALSELARALGHEEEARALLARCLPPLVAMADPLGLERAREQPEALCALCLPDEEGAALRSVAPRTA